MSVPQDFSSHKKSFLNLQHLLHVYNTISNNFFSSISDSINTMNKSKDTKLRTETIIIVLKYMIFFSPIY